MSCELEDPCGSCSTSKDEKFREADLMEEYWFFHNMLDHRAKTSKPSSTPACFSNTNKEFVTTLPPGGLCSTPANLPKHDDSFTTPNLLRTPSLPPSIEIEKLAPVEDISRQSTDSKLQRSFSSVASAPPPPPPLPIAKSLPPSMRHEKSVQREEVNRRSKLQRSFSSAATAPPLPPIAKSNSSSVFMSTTPKPSIPRLQRAGSSVEGPIKDNKKSPRSKEVNFQVPSRIKSSKSLSQLEVEEVQGFMDLGFVFDKAEISPSILSIIPGLQDKRPSEDDGGDHKVARPYLSEAWFAQRSEPPRLNWVDRKSAVDMKEQLKEWARSVASKMRQEC